MSLPLKVLMSIPGVTGEPIKASFGRYKASGAMWGGNSSFVLPNGFTFHFDLWYHGSEDEPTQEEILEHARLKHVDLPPEMQNKYPNPRWKGQFINGVDAYWNCIVLNNSLYLHLQGWFDDKELENKIRDRYSLRTDLTEEYLTSLGFIKVI